MKYLLRNIFPHTLLRLPFSETDKEFGKFSQLSFSFRPGFSERVTSRLENLIENDLSWQLYRGLSSLLPRFSMACMGILVLLAAVIIYLNGGFDPDAIFGREKLDENNFISYLILQK